MNSVLIIINYKLIIGQKMIVSKFCLLLKYATRKFRFQHCITIQMFWIKIFNKSFLILLKSIDTFENFVSH